MSTTNYPSATPQSTPPGKDFKNIIIGLLAVGILGTWGYFLWDKNNSDKEKAKLQSDYISIDSAKDELEISYKAALGRLDSLTGYNNELEGKLSTQNSEISKLRSRIDGLMKKQKLTEAEKKEAEALIKELNDKISGLEQEVVRLTSEVQVRDVKISEISRNLEDTTRKLENTITAKKELEKKVDIGTTLVASAIRIRPVNEKKSGKEKETTSAKRVDKLIISFDVENRIAASGNVEIYVCITAPDGKPVAVEALGSGIFKTREGEEKLYTTKVELEYETGTKKHVEFAWKQNSDFQQGNYKIEIYQNGYSIGNGVVVLKKGGLFG